MIRAEHIVRGTFAPLATLNLPQVDILLVSSREFHEANNIPIRTARWDNISRPRRLLLDMVTLPVNQGHLGIGHGGLITAILDDVAGFAAGTWAAEQGKTVLAKELRHVWFIKPLPLYTIIRVTGIFEGARGSTVFASAWIERLRDQRMIAKGNLVGKMVDEVKTVSG